jgi:hypothetical protein
MRLVRGETVTRAATRSARWRGSVALAMGLAVTLAVGCVHGAAAQQIPVQLGGSTSSLVGLPFDVPLQVDMSARSDKLGSFALTLRWNPAVLKFLDGQNGNFGDVKANDSAAADSGIIRLAAANPAGVGGRVLLGVARFVPLTTAADTFKLNVTELYAAGSFADLLPSAVWSNRAYCNALGRFGDIDGDGVVNSKDALLALTSATGTAVANAALGDVDGDGVTGARDALLMLAAGIGLDVSGFRVGLTAPGACAAPRRPLLALTPGSVTLDLGQHMQYTAVATDSTGAAVAVGGLLWSSSNPLVATVDTLGQVSALAAGSTTVTVQRASGTSASAVVTVLARHTHWVDALANPDPDNELGAPELPFATIPQALAYARAGDTIMVGPGRYEDTLVIAQPIVLMGDTSGGGALPLISARSVTDFGVIVHTPGRVELHRLRIDTLTQGVDVPRADTLLVRGMEFRAPASVYYSSLYVDTATAVYIQRSTFFGSGAGYYYANAGITVDSAALVVMDSSTIGEYGDDGLDLYAVDSVFVRGSMIQHNAGYGLFASGAGIGSAFSGNRFTQNGYGHVYLDVSRGAHFDHNRASGAGYDGIQVYGADTTAGVTFVGDSLAAQAGWPIYLSTYDTLAVDSVVIVGNSGGVYLDNGRSADFRHSKLLGLTSYGLEVYPSSFDTTYVLLRDVAFSGLATGVCDQCAEMLYGSSVSVDADSVTMTHMDYGLDLSNSRLRLSHATLDDYYYGVYADCGAVALTGDTLRNGEYGVELDGCGAGDSLVVSGSTFSNHTSSAISGSSAAATVSSGNHFTNAYEAIAHNCGQLRVTGDTATGGYYGVYAYGCTGTDTLSVDQSSFAGGFYGAYLSSGRQRVTNSRFMDNGYYAVDAESAPAVISNNQVLRPQSGGLYHYWSSPSAGSLQILNNVVTCDAYGATNATGIGLTHYSSTVKDTLIADGNSVTNCYQGMSLYGGWQQVARYNTVALPTSVQGYQGIYVNPDTGAVVFGNSVSGWGVNGSIVAYSARSAVLDSNVVSGGIDLGLYLASQFDSLHVRGNTITNLSYRSPYVSPTAAIRLDGSTLGGLNYMAEIRYNHITGSTNGIVLNRTGSDTLTVQVDSNTVRNTDSVGVLLAANSYGMLRMNAIDSSGLDAVRISGYRAGAAALVNNNNFTRSQHFGVNNLTTYVVDATNNWWGDLDNSGPACATVCGTGDSVSTNVTYSPWLGSAVSTYPPAPPLFAAARTAAPLAGSAPAPRVARRAWQAPATPAPRPQRGAAAAASVGPTIPVAPPLTSTNRVSGRLAAAAAQRAARLQRREAQQAQRLQQLEARRSAREQRHAERLKAQAVKQQQAPSAPPQRRPQ